MGINAINHNNHMAFTRQAYANKMANAKEQTPVVDEEAVSARISNEALEKLNASNQAVCNLDEAVIRSALLSREEIEARKASPLAQTQRQEIEVTGIYGEETLAYFVDTQLSGKLEKSNQIANQMETLIRGAVYNKDATVEQRAIDRESALKLAQHIADNYFENPEEAKSFMDTINKFAENDILRDKGYVALDNSDTAPFKTYTMPGAPVDYVRMDYNTLQDIMGGKESQADKEDKLNSIKNEVVKRFDENEKDVTKIIEQVKALISKRGIDSNYGASLKNLFSAIDPEQSKKWNNIVNLLNPS